MVDDFFGSYSGGSDVFTDPASFDLGGIDNFVPDEPSGIDNFVPNEPSGSAEDPVLNDIAYQGDTTQPNNVSRNPNVSPADATRLINSDSSGLLKRLFTDKNGNLNLQALGGIGGGILGALGSMQPNVKKVGYQGGIPKYDAVRNMVNAPPTRAQGYRPGQGGINYGGDVSFVPKGTGASMAATQPSQTVYQAPAGVAGQPGLAIGAANGSNGPLTGIMAGLAGMGGQMPQGGLPRAMPQPQPRPATAQPVAQDDPFYQSPEYKAYQNDSSNMMATMDMYDSPYFGRMGSGSVGRAMDAAYEKYKNIAPQQDQSDQQRQMPPGSIGGLAGLLGVAPAVNNTPAGLSYAAGGLTNLARGRYLQGETDGMADKIPAKIGQDQPAALSHGEFVIPADVVSHLGNGNSDAGAKKLYSMMDKIRTARTGTKKQGKEINPDKFMPGGLAQAYANGGEVKKFAGTTGSAVSGLGTAASAGVTGSETTPNTFAGEYIGDMLGKGQALANAPYQQYMGPLTAGESGLQSKVFGGLQNTNFPNNFGQSFSSTGAYAPPQMNMGAYNTQPIGTGARAPGSMQDMLNQGSNGFGDFGSMQSPDGGMNGQPDPIMPINHFGFMGQPDATMDGGRQFDVYQPKQPGDMPQGGLAGLAGRMPQQQPQQPQGIASQYMNPYLQSVLDPQMAELRRQNDITNMMGNAKMTSAGAFGGGRQAILNAENNRNLMQEMNKTVGQGYASAYDKAQNQFNIEQGQGLSLANLMANQGTTQRNIEAEGIAADKAAFEAARENPYKMLQFQQSMLQGMPISATNIETATPSKLQQAMAGAGGLAGMFPTNSNVSMKDVSDLLNKLGLGSTPG